MKILKSTSLKIISRSLAVLLLGYPANGQTKRMEIRGIVRDEREAVIVGAGVVLASEQGLKIETVTDGEGSFKFAVQSIGRYRLKVSSIGFAEYEQQLTIVDGDPVRAITVTLYPTINESLVVESDALDSLLDADREAGTRIINGRELEALPDDPDRLSEQLQMIATSSGSAPGGATVTVDGFIVHGRLPSKGSIRAIRINPDLYSAEYDKAPYRGGRIEILTKPGAEAFHGSGFFNFNDSKLNARNAFASAKPASSTRRYGLELGGPIVSKKSGFYLNVERREIDEASTINAIVLNDSFQFTPLSRNVPAPMRLTVGSLRFDWQVNVANTLIARYDFNHNRLQHQGIGGFNLADRGFDTNVVEHTFRFTDTAVVGTTMVNEARLGITLIRVAGQAESNAPAILIPGAFSSGGASAQSQRSNALNLEIGDNFSLPAGKHKLKLGGQILGRLSSDRRTDNFNGTFVFGGGLAPDLNSNNQVVTGPGGPILVSISGIEQYRRTLLNLPGGVPTRFSLASGDPSAHVNQWLFSAYAQDEWKLRRNISISMGLRYEGQSNPTDKLSIAPRFGIAYAVDKNQHWILRARAGLFYSRIPDALVSEVQRQNGQRGQQILINNPSFPNPFIGGSVSNSIPTIKQLQPRISPEASWQMKVELEHQLPHGWNLNFSESYSRGRSVLRTVNINAPIVSGTTDPRTAPRPLGINEDILQYQSTGETGGSVMFIGINQTNSRRFNLFSGYLYFHLRSNADTSGTMPQSSFTQAGEWARPFWQSTHRAFVAGTAFLPWKLRASPSLSAASGTPFNITTGRDNNGDGNFTDRPSIVNASAAGAILTKFGALSPDVINGTLPRNFGTNPPTITLDLNVARDFTFGIKKATKDPRYKLAVNVRSSNLLNHVNVTGLNGVLTSPFFDRANSAAPARKIEFGARFTF